MCFWHQNQITVMLLQWKGLILSVQEHLILEIPFVLKSIVKPFHHDLKERWKSYESQGQLAVSLKMPLMQETILWQTLECYKLWELIAKKKYTGEYGATTATSLKQKAAYRGTGLLLLIHSSVHSKLLQYHWWNVVFILIYWSKQFTRASQESYWIKLIFPGENG